MYIQVCSASNGKPVARNPTLRKSHGTMSRSVTERGVSWAGIGTSRELSLYVALLGSSLPESNPYRKGNFELELRLCIVEGGPLCCVSARFLGDVYHPNIFPNTGLSSYPPNFIPALCQASHRIFRGKETINNNYFKTKSILI